MIQQENERRSGRQTRIRYIKRVLWGILFVNLAVSMAKLLYGLYTHSAAMQADGIHSLFDGAGNVVGLVGITLASRPADESHPYGHAKFETFSSTIIGVLLLMAAVTVGYGAVSALLSGTSSVIVTPASFAIMAATMAVNGGITLFERHAAKRASSELLTADAAHTLSDVLVSLGVLIGLALAQVGLKNADSIVALAVSVIILYTAWRVFRRVGTTLSDSARIPAEDIERVASRRTGVQECHRIRTRGTPSEVYLDFHILVDPLMTVCDAHELAENIERDLQQEYPAIVDITIHIEPNDDTQRLKGDA
ncbi:MAG: cation diffusion facilitator family transporter [Coriobacteriales bacterium]|jgi:cation diffusion facilitator family transporter|nr:cation diffusion facilitator family transporter [Coriobacteriales bacterium]